MPRPNDSPDVATSKTLAYILRHGAEKESLHIRTDGYIKLDDVVSSSAIFQEKTWADEQLARPKMRGIDVETVLKLVEENAKKRFEVVWGYDPSPPLPKKKGQSKKQKAKAPIPKEGEVDAAGVDDLTKEMEQAILGESKEEEWKELPLVVVDKEGADEGIDTSATWFIRASQGHSIKLEGTAHLTPVEDDEEGRQRVGLMVHGTRDDLWDIIRMYHPHGSYTIELISRRNGFIKDGQTTYPPSPRGRESPNHPKTKFAFIHLPRPRQSIGGGYQSVHECQWCSP